MKQKNIIWIIIIIGIIFIVGSQGKKEVSIGVCNSYSCSDFGSLGGWVDRDPSKGAGEANSCCTSTSVAQRDLCKGLGYTSTYLTCGEPVGGCTTDNDCPTNSYCEGGNCLTCEQDGTLCSRDAHCCSNNCVGIYCEPVGTMCEDTESGNGRDVTGTVTIGTNSWTDYCRDSFTVNEYFCLNNELETAQWNCDNYDEKCENGKCVDNPQTCTGRCKENSCSTYGGCSIGTGTCGTGYCCSGDCCDIGNERSCVTGSEMGLKLCTSGGWGTCIIVECITDNDCTIGTYKKCLDGNCVQCIIDSDCVQYGNYECVDNACKSIPSKTPTEPKPKSQCLALLEVCEPKGSCFTSKDNCKTNPIFLYIGGFIALMFAFKMFMGTKK